MKELDDELRDLKREIVESRGLLIKTNNLANLLSADLKSIAKRQASLEKRSIYSSGAGVAILLTVLLGAVKLSWDARVEHIQAETQSLRESASKHAEEQKSLRKTQDERLRAEGAALAFYELIRAGKRQEVVDGWEVLRKEPLSRAELAFFADQVELAKGQLSVRAFQTGRDHLAAGRYHEAALALEQALELDSSSAHSALATLDLARAYEKQNRSRDAITLLTPLSLSGSDKELVSEALLLLATCHESMKEWADAKQTLRTLIRRFPESSAARTARIELSEMASKQN